MSFKLTEDEMELAAQSMARGSSRVNTTQRIIQDNGVLARALEAGLNEKELRREVNLQIRFADKASPEFRPSKYGSIWRLEREILMEVTREKLKTAVDDFEVSLREATTRRKDTREKLQAQLDEYLDSGATPTENDEALRLVSSILKLEEGELNTRGMLVKVLQQLSGDEEIGRSLEEQQQGRLPGG